MSANSSRRYPPELRERAVRIVAEIREQHETEWAAMRGLGVARCRDHRDGAQMGSPGRDRCRCASGSIDRGVGGAQEAEARKRRTEARQRYLGSVLSFGSPTRLFLSWTVSAAGCRVGGCRGVGRAARLLGSAGDGFRRRVHGCGCGRGRAVAAGSVGAALGLVDYRRACRALVNELADLVA